MAFNILIVDDSQVIRHMIARTIRMAGVPIGALVEAVNGEEALDAIGNNWIDLVLADINMPVMDGYTMIEKMQQDEIMKQVPVVVVSTEGSETKISKLKEHGVKAFLHKPFTPEMLRNVVSEVLGAWESEDADARDDSF
jgi:two-component system, chemotaxis family, chemotaxis protein CheY